MESGLQGCTDTLKRGLQLRLEQPVEPVSRRRVDDDGLGRAIIRRHGDDVAPVQRTDAVRVLLQRKARRGRGQMMAIVFGVARVMVSSTSTSDCIAKLRRGFFTLAKYRQPGRCKSASTPQQMLHKTPGKPCSRRKPKPQRGPCPPAFSRLHRVDERNSSPPFT